MAETLTEEVRTVVGVGEDALGSGWKTELRDDLARALAEGGGRWSRAIAAVGWIHLVAFLIGQAMHDSSRTSDPRLVLVWGGEFAAVLAALRAIAGPGWARSSSAVGLVTRIWGTFLILSFNLVMLNAMTGWEAHWYKPAWGTLSTCFLATLAWLFTPRLFVPAVQMYFTALLMVRFPGQENLIYGVSWWLALLGIAHRIRRRERASDGRDRDGAIDPAGD